MLSEEQIQGQEEERQSKGIIKSMSTSKSIRNPWCTAINNRHRKDAVHSGGKKMQRAAAIVQQNKSYIDLIETTHLQIIT